jgi:hypothetical protein
MLTGWEIVVDWICWFAILVEFFGYRLRGTFRLTQYGLDAAALLPAVAT